MQIATKDFTYKFVTYVNSSLDLRLKGHIGDSSDKLALFLYSGADFAGAKDSSKFSTGIRPSQAQAHSF